MKDAIMMEEGEMGPVLVLRAAVCASLWHLLKKGQFGFSEF